jgi:hypothetical protein
MKWVIQDQQPTLYCYWKKDSHDGYGELTRDIDKATLYSDEEKEEIGEVYYGMDTRWREFDKAVLDEEQLDRQQNVQRKDILAHNEAKEYFPESYSTADAQAQLDKVFDTYSKKVYGKHGGKGYYTNDWLPEFLSLINLRPEQVWEYIMLRTMPPLPGQGPIGSEHSSLPRFIQFHKTVTWFVPNHMQVNVMTFPSRNNLVKYDVYGGGRMDYPPYNMCRWLVTITPRGSHGAYHARKIMALFEAHGNNELHEKIKYELKVWKENTVNK